MDLKDLYRDVILDHNKRPRNFGRLDPCDTSAEGHNPLCGDRLSLTLRFSGDHIDAVRFEGQGCAISTASASLMTEAIQGLTPAAARDLQARVHHTLTGPESTPAAAELGKLAALAGVRDYPARVKCASLAWHTLTAALDHHDAERSGGQAAHASSTGTPTPVSTE